MAEIDPTDPGGGNTISPPEKKKQISPAKRWCFTYNNFPDLWKEILVPKFQEFGLLYVVGVEVGEKGTPHLQGYIENRAKKFRPTELKLPKQIHWEKCKGDRKANYDYCTKDGVFISNIPVPRVRPTPDIYGWQLLLKNKIEGYAEDNCRKIHWIWSKDGKFGKSTMVDWLVAERRALVVSGKATDMKCGIVKYFEKFEEYPEVLVFDVPRSMQNYLSYTGMEEIKNGVFFSPKYETEMVRMPKAHVIVMANFPPDLTDQDMSHDRFEVMDLQNLTISDWMPAAAGDGALNPTPEAEVPEEENEIDPALLNPIQGIF